MEKVYQTDHNFALNLNFNSKYQIKLYNECLLISLENLDGFIDFTMIHMILENSISKNIMPNGNQKCLKIK